MGLSDYKREIVGAIGVLLIGWSTGVIDPEAFDVPIYWRLFATAVFLVAVAAWIGTGKVEDELPEDHGVFLIVQDDTRLGGGKIWELTEDDFENLTVSGGSLYQWDTEKKRIYECRSYDDELNIAEANWKESKPASALNAERSVEDVLAAIRELRLQIEPEAAEAKALKRQMRGIIRRLDTQRAKQQQEIIDDYATPDLGDETLTDIIEDELPEDLHPHSGDDHDPDPVTDHPEADVSFDVLDSGGEALATDGGNDE